MRLDWREKGGYSRLAGGHAKAIAKNLKRNETGGDRLDRMGATCQRYQQVLIVVLCRAARGYFVFGGVGAMGRQAGSLGEILNEFPAELTLSFSWDSRLYNRQSYSE